MIYSNKSSRSQTITITITAVVVFLILLGVPIILCGRQPHKANY